MVRLLDQSLLLQGGEGVDLKTETKPVVCAVRSVIILVSGECSSLLMSHKKRHTPSPLPSPSRERYLENFPSLEERVF